jgi:hypothetical protein
VPKKLTYEYVKSKFEEKGWELLSKEYVNSWTKLRYRCPIGHEHSIRWNDFSQGHDKCGRCIGNVEVTLNIAKGLFEKAGYKLLSTEYINNRTKLLVSCTRGHVYETTYDNFQQDKKCWECYLIDRLNPGGEDSNFYKGGVVKSGLSLYETYAPQLEKYQAVYNIEQDGMELLGIECTYCKKIFVPKFTDVKRRIEAIKGKTPGESNLYCSGECKKACPTYGQILWPKDHKPYENSRPNQKQWATLVKKRDDYTCQKCGTTEGQLYAHHIDPVINNPIEAMDIDNGTTLCKDCHKQAHTLPDCGCNELKCKNK